MNHDAIRRVYPNVVNIDDSTGAFDGDGNQITIDQSLVNTAASAIQTELNWQNLRDERNKLLTATDYLALSDVTMSDEMRTYRQALRDLPANTSDPANPVWPTKPGGAS